MRASVGRRFGTGLVVGLIALAVGVVIIVNAFRLVATETFVRYEYRHADFPADSGISLSDRRALALTGLTAIRPRTAGIRLLDEAALPDGSAAFNERELAHMTDVRTLYGRALWLQLALAIALGSTFLGLILTRHRRVLPRGLLFGALGALVVAVAVIPLVMLGFDWFFEAFHGVFFKGDTWRFARGDTLLRIYPELFWVDTSRTIAAVVVLQAVLLASVAWLWSSRTGNAT